jgi:hypothetical protein
MAQLFAIAGATATSVLLLLIVLVLPLILLLKHTTMYSAGIAVYYYTHRY